MNILLTGGTGFVGRGLLRRFKSGSEYTVLLALRASSFILWMIKLLIRCKLFGR